ncbi:MAG: hypothetical protein U1A26_01590 [Candidatus Sungbacteria bacterium]|nr:hypothetical protein [Candidatus Sungbacteria bacterium]
MAKGFDPDQTKITQGITAQDVVEASVTRFRSQYPDMAARTIIPIELVSCMETIINRVLEGRQMDGKRMAE